MDPEDEERLRNVIINLTSETPPQPSASSAPSEPESPTEFFIPLLHKKNDLNNEDDPNKPKRPKRFYMPPLRKLNNEDGNTQSNKPSPEMHSFIMAKIAEKFGRNMMESEAQNNVVLPPPRPPSTPFNPDDHSGPSAMERLNRKIEALMGGEQSMWAQEAEEEEEQVAPVRPVEVKYISKGIKKLNLQPVEKMEVDNETKEAETKEEKPKEDLIDLTKCLNPPGYKPNIQIAQPLTDEELYQKMLKERTVDDIYKEARYHKRRADRKFSKFPSCLAEPSPLGQMLVKTFRRRKTPPKFTLPDVEVPPGCKIKPFQFDTKSPDDVVRDSMKIVTRYSRT